MEEHLADTLMSAATALHWLGQHRVANALTLFSRLARALNLETLDGLDDFVTETEQDAAHGR